MKVAPPLRLAIGRAEVGAAPDDPPTPSLSPLVAGLRRGSGEALVQAFDRWHQRVRVLARRLLADEAAAEDVVQDVFVSLPPAAARFRGESDFEAFLLGIAVKCARRHVRAAARRRAALARLARLRWMIRWRRSAIPNATPIVSSSPRAWRTPWRLSPWPSAKRSFFVRSRISHRRKPPRSRTSPKAPCALAFITRAAACGSCRLEDDR